MNRIIFFAQIRELIGVESILLDVSQLSISDLLQKLSQQGNKWSMALTEKTVLCAVNQSLVDFDYIIQPDDEIAFFPPVTGG
ncbi:MULTISPECIES: molybdopterin synthase sulfur carrier subunit [unclassified Gilliamella]|uniref:molybdopterin synthase sulfur carrier subunit n=1 Tax=unclassified Gilliamella TaxID=2685620 RepID=UPI00080E3A1A|nr:MULTISPECIES: molybdopterin synthase sulfur carrier subunit [Gilliamella]MCX8642043.1 molybdopterin synthase sulfur carrier subunit [Gilliamella sp. B3835]MCX8707229.1 molybdopterin synthase sulfur carrier subunit [Gilliamella sp. B3783]MCX8710862.1 molybdopterin synthase sulfur carrier subunit [Gilliamella sp. B3780]MCX8714030.1 molybdopterin synthase sulfur carrier subunit [Gilliamella sp. B3781]MCX8716211.1 molybdopterin synthase sulfur carrier subunit [Gilliamella sp. B3784]